MGQHKLVYSAGVRQYGEAELAEWIENSLIVLADRNGFYEYYDPDSGRGLGEKDFSWTAALVIDLIAQRLRNYSHSNYI